METTQQLQTNPVNICPGCAIEQLTKGKTGITSTGPVTRHIQRALKAFKEAWILSDDVSAYGVVSLVYSVLAAASAAVAGLIKPLMPLAKFFVLMLLYVLDSARWVWQEKSLYVAIFKALAAAAITLLQACVLYLFLELFAVPVLTFLYKLLQSGYSF